MARQSVRRNSECLLHGPSAAANAAGCTGDQNRSAHVRFLCEGFQFGHYGWQIFSNRGMNVHRALDHRVRRLRIHDVQQSMNYFVASDPENRGAQNLFCIRINADFDEALCLAFLVGATHSSHGIFRHQCTTTGLAYFPVRHAAVA